MENRLKNYAFLRDLIDQNIFNALSELLPENESGNSVDTTDAIVNLWKQSENLTKELVEILEKIQTQSVSADKFAYLEAANAAKNVKLREENVPQIILKSIKLLAILRVLKTHEEFQKIKTQEVGQQSQKTVPEEQKPLAAPEVDDSHSAQNPAEERNNEPVAPPSKFFYQQAYENMNALFEKNKNQIFEYKLGSSRTQKAIEALTSSPLDMNLGFRIAELEKLRASYGEKTGFDGITLFGRDYKSKEVKRSALNKLLNLVIAKEKELGLSNAAVVDNDESQEATAGSTTKAQLTALEIKALQQGHLGKIFEKLPQMLRDQVLDESFVRVDTPTPR